MSGRIGDAAHGRLVAMLDDPECGGDVLLVGLALLARIDLSWRRDDPRGIATPAQMGRLVYGSTTTMHGYRVKEALRSDIRTYKAPVGTHDDPCEAPMIRRAGCCGSTRGGRSYLLIDYTTGERRNLNYCSRHHDWARAVHEDNRREAPDPNAQWGGAPLPAANHGGVLARHFPEIDWPAYWRKLDPRWVEHPEHQPRPTPRFQLIVGDDESEGDGESGDRPALHLAPAGRNS